MEEIYNTNQLLNNTLLINLDLEQILKINKIYKDNPEASNITAPFCSWKILSSEFCKILENFTTNKADIFAGYNIIKEIETNENTYLNKLFSHLNIFSPEKLLTENRKIEEILDEVENFTKDLISKNNFSLEEVYISILYLLYIFLQESVTGSGFMFIKETEKTDYKKDLEKFYKNNFKLLEENFPEKLKLEIYQYISVNGELPYQNINLILLYVTCYKLIVNSKIFDNFYVNNLWKSRMLFLQDKMLREQTSIIKEKIFTYLSNFDIEKMYKLYTIQDKIFIDFCEENELDKYLIKDFEISKGLLKLEKSFVCLRYYQYKQAKNLIEEAKILFNLKIELTGKFGRKTKFQDFDVPVLIVNSSSSTLEKSKELVEEKFEKISEVLNEKDIEIKSEIDENNNDTNNNSELIEENNDIPTGIPRKIALASENPLLEKPNLTGNIEENKDKIEENKETSLSLFDQLYVSALLNSYKHSLPDEDMLREVIMAYVNKSIEKSYDWLVFSKLLIHKSLAEEKRSKLVERSLLQIESLCVQFNDRLPNSFSRMRYIFICDYPFIWQMKKIYAEMFMSYGALMTAFDIFKELKMHEDCVNCLYLAGKNERALEYAENIIKIKEDPGVYCILGEIYKKEEYFHKALEVSNGKYTRAYRCLGKYKLSIEQDEEALKFYEKAMEINPIFPDIWFSMGILYMKKKDWKMSCRCYARAVQLDDTGAQSWANLGISFIHLGKNKEAMKALEEGYKLGRNNWRILENIIYVAIDIEDIQKIITGINNLFDLDKNDKVTPHMFYKLITLLLMKYDTIGKRQVEFYKENIYLIFEKFSMKNGTTPEIWDLYIFFIDSMEIKLNRSLLNDEDIQKFTEAMIEIRLKQIRNYMIEDLWEKNEIAITNVSKLINKLKEELKKVKDISFVEEKINFVQITQSKVDKFYKMKELDEKISGNNNDNDNKANDK